MKKLPSPKGRWSPILSILLIATVGCNKMTPEIRNAVPVTTQSESQTATSAKNGHGHIKPGTPLETSGVFNFSIHPENQLIIAILGSHRSGFYPFAELKHTPNHIFPLDYVCDLTVYIQQLTYHVTTDVKDLHSRLLLRVLDNKWRVFRDSVGKYNYDDKGFEVYDKDGHIAFNVNLVDGSTQKIYINGIIPCTSTSLGYYSPSFASDVPFGTPALDKAFDHLYDSLPIRPLFRYTGKNWQHARL